MKRSFFAITAFTLATTAFSASASNYPPNYTWDEQCQYNGPVMACRAKQGDKVDLRLYYTGTLSSTQHGAVFVYVQFNWLDGARSVFVPMGNITYADSLQESVLISSGYLSCESQSSCVDSPQEMKHLLAWGSYGYRYNAWDFEVAFVGTNGVWDSQGGANYAFHFDGQ